MMDIERMKTKYEDNESTSDAKIEELKRENDSLSKKYRSAEESLTLLAEERSQLEEKL